MENHFDSMEEVGGYGYPHGLALPWLQLWIFVWSKKGQRDISLMAIVDISRDVSMALNKDMPFYHPHYQLKCHQNEKKCKNLRKLKMCYFGGNFGGIFLKFLWAQGCGCRSSGGIFTCLWATSWLISWRGLLGITRWWQWIFEWQIHKCKNPKQQVTKSQNWGSNL